MNITLPPFDTEQQQALTDLVDSHNAAATTSLTSEQFLVSVLLGVINDKKRQNIIATGEQLLAAAQSLPSWAFILAHGQRNLASVRAR